MVEVRTVDILLPGGTTANQVVDDPEASWLAQLCLALVKMSIIQSWFASLKISLGSPLKFSSKSLPCSQERHFWRAFLIVHKHCHDTTPAQLFFKSSLYKANVQTSIVYDIGLLELLPLQCLRAVVRLRFKVLCFVCGWWILQKNGAVICSSSCVQLVELLCDKALLPKLYIGNFETKCQMLPSNKHL